MQHQRKSFTLIEMLIVIVIIGILAAALVPRLSALQGRARDTDRKVDLRNIYNAVEFYLADYGKYPLPISEVSLGVYSGGCAYFTYPNNCRVASFHPNNLNAWLIPITGYIYPIPKDPIQNYSRGGVYGWVNQLPMGYTGIFIYSYGNVYNNPPTFDLTARLESTTDPDRCQVKQYKYLYPAVDSCASSVNHQIYEYSPHSMP